MRINKSFVYHLGLATQLLALSLYGCGKKEKGASEDGDSAVNGADPGVSDADGNEVVLAGVLNLNSSASLMGTTKGVLAFNMASGSLMGQQDVEVDADGNFAVTVAKADEQVQTLLDEMAKSRDERDWDAMFAAASAITDVGSMTVDDIKGMADADLNANITELATSLKEAGSMTLLVAYDKSGDVVAEASSFRFIGMPTASGKSLSGLPNADLKGNVGFGKISGTGTDVTSEVGAGDALDLSESALDSLADAGRALKMVKNKYMNDKWSVQPFYFWKSNVSKDDVIGAFSDIKLNSYHGYGFYVPSEGDQDLTYADLCGGKEIKFIPPSAITEKQWDDSGEQSVSEYTNVGSTAGTQGDSKICSGDGFYGRQDIRDGKTSYMLNFGTGGSIQDSPEGLWTMTIEGETVGQFDLALASPMVDDKPTVLLPQVKFTSTGTKVTGVVVELYRWNGSAYEKVTDMAPVKKLFSEFSASITRSSDNGEARTRLTVNDDGTVTGAFDGSIEDNGQVLNAAVEKANVSSFAVYYNIGNASYRMEFR